MAVVSPLQGHSLDESALQLGQGDCVEPPFPTVTSAFYHHARTSPDTIALRDLPGSPKELTYGQLSRRAQELAAQLIAQGVCPDSRVPLVAKRGERLSVITDTPGACAGKSTMMRLASDMMNNDVGRRDD